MANCASANKRIRQNDVHRLRNKGAKSEIKTLTKKLEDSITAREVETARTLYPLLISKMDKAGRKRVYHPNTVSRKKSRLTRLLATLDAASPEEA